MVNEQNDVAGLDTFEGWDDNSTDASDFFSGLDAEMGTEKIGGSDNKNKESQIKVEDFAPQAPEVETKEEESFDDFSEEAVESSEEEVPTEEAPTNSVVATLKYLESKGYAKYELDEDAELTEEMAGELIEDGIEQSIEERIEEMFGELPPIAKHFNKFVINGGNPAEFFNAIKTPVGISPDMDIDDEANQEKALRHLLKEEELEDELIDTQIQFYKDSKTLGKMAKAKFSKWSAAQTKQQEDLEKQQKQRKIQEKERRRKEKETVADLVQEGVEGFKFSRKEKKELPSYMSDYSIRLENGRQVTPLQKDLYEALQNPEKSVILAKILKSDFDFKDFKVAARTEITKKERDSIRHAEDAVPKKGAGSSRTSRKSLADLLG